MSLSYLDVTARARAMYLEGQPQNEIARALGVSENTVTKWKQKSVWPASPREAAAAALRKAAFGLFREGKSQQEIAEQLNLSENTITTWKKQNHWVARMSLLRDKLLDEVLTQVGKVVMDEVAHRYALKLDRPAESLQRAFAYLCQQLDREESTMP